MNKSITDMAGPKLCDSIQGFSELNSIKSKMRLIVFVKWKGKGGQIHLLKTKSVNSCNLIEFFNVHDSIPVYLCEPLHEGL